MTSYNDFSLSNLFFALFVDLILCTLDAWGVGDFCSYFLPNFSLIVLIKLFL